MISQLIPVKKENTKGIAVAISLFVMQFVYYQLQDYVLEGFLQFLPGGGTEGWDFLAVNQIATLLSLFHIFVHAAFSVLIVHYLYRDIQSTWLVFYFSIILFAVFLLTHFLGKVFDFFIFNIISTKIHLFIASPFKTIFSIPSLKLREDEEKVDNA